MHFPQIRAARTTTLRMLQILKFPFFPHRECTQNYISLTVLAITNEFFILRKIRETGTISFVGQKFLLSLLCFPGCKLVAVLTMIVPQGWEKGSEPQFKSPSCPRRAAAHRVLALHLYKLYTFPMQLFPLEPDIVGFFHI